MNKVFCCFTCERDLPLLNAHFAAIRHYDPSAMVYYIFDKSEQPQAPEGAYMLTTDFNRRNNLIGLECHWGMLNVMKQLAEINEADYVIKIDSDCYYINDFEDGYSLIGTAPGLSYYCKGCCYKISYESILNCINYLKSSGYQDTTGRLEDHLISMICAITSQPGSVKILNAIDYNKEGEVNTINSCIFQSGYFNYTDDLPNVKYWIDCGDKKFVDDYDEANLPKQLAKARAMEFLLNYFHKKPHIDLELG